MDKSPNFKMFEKTVIVIYFTNELSISTCIDPVKGIVKKRTNFPLTGFDNLAYIDVVERCEKNIRYKVLKEKT